MVSIIVPIYNEEQTLPGLLENLQQFTQAELIFVDGGSQDLSIAILEDFAKANASLGLSIKILQSPQKGRSAQMNYGAARSSGEILLFIHSDSKLPKTAVGDVENASQKYQAGCFRLKFQPGTFLLFCCGYLSDFRVFSRKIMFGDQGIFIQKQLFEDLGGFKNQPLMEDYQLSMNLKSKNIPIVLLKSSIITSSRRFLENGTLKTMVKMQRLQSQYRRGKLFDKNLWKSY